ncbi:hypothetical protein F3Y22_tig00002841pilonHSYRG00140 [Hibiscus syriacus]|uniref:Uncharacterized protein n=1 Tax=Hibiscus syriacus TaxID=106335 RepID=A0A6A3CPA7_HIBSY|nr:hypothetical protein F3Y22_tig00002841pilonHSYRG00140 [Hibiscus syriacus]
MLHIFLLFSLILTSTHVLAQDFALQTCPRALLPPPATLAKPKQTSPSTILYFRASASPATPQTSSMRQSPGIRSSIPGVNGLGISAARLDLAPGGVVPMHTPPVPTSFSMSFMINAAGRRPSLAIVTFTAPSPGLQILDFALFANDLPSSLLEKSTFLTMLKLRSSRECLVELAKPCTWKLLIVCLCNSVLISCMC